jgi:hypothetical protein
MEVGHDVVDGGWEIYGSGARPGDWYMEPPKELRPPRGANIVKFFELCEVRQGLATYVLTLFGHIETPSISKLGVRFLTS